MVEVTVRVASNAVGFERPVAVSARGITNSARPGSWSHVKAVVVTVFDALLEHVQVVVLGTFCASGEVQAFGAFRRAALTTLDVSFEFV